MVEKDIGKRWEKGLPHHPKSMEVKKLITEMDAEGEYRFGGDGGNGETLLYYLDVYFGEKNEEEK